MCIACSGLKCLAVSLDVTVTGLSVCLQHWPGSRNTLDTELVYLGIHSVLFLSRNTVLHCVLYFIMVCMNCSLARDKYCSWYWRQRCKCLRRFWYNCVTFFLFGCCKKFGWTYYNFVAIASVTHLGKHYLSCGPISTPRTNLYTIYISLFFLNFSDAPIGIKLFVCIQVNVFCQ